MFTCLIIPHESALYRRSVALRHEILRQPLGLSFSPEELAAEADSWHLVLMDTDHPEQVLACLVLKPLDAHEVKMRQVAVASDWQGKGLGKMLVQYAEQVAQVRGYTQMVLHARLTAVPFYLQLGYDTDHQEFIEVSIPHYKMWRRLCAATVMSE